jgi:hypothetical protein
VGEIDNECGFGKTVDMSIHLNKEYWSEGKEWMRRKEGEAITPCLIYVLHRSAFPVKRGSKRCWTCRVMDLITSPGNLHRTVEVDGNISLPASIERHRLQNPVFKSNLGAEGSPPLMSSTDVPSSKP